MAGYCVEKYAARTFLILGSSKRHPNICTSALSIVAFSCSTFLKNNLYHKKPSDESGCEGIASWAAVNGCLGSVARVDSDGLNWKQ